MKSSTLLITVKDQQDMDFLKALLTKLGYDINEISTEDVEDAMLLKLMVSEKKEDYISKDDILDALSDT